MGDSFVERLRDLRPYLSLKVVWAIGLVEYRDDADPRKAAVVYHRRTQPEPAALAPAKKRAK
jgi:hypothetical protein